MKSDLLKKAFKKRSAHEYVIFGVIILLGIALDQLTKILAVNFLKPIDELALIEGVLHLKFHLNDGAAFGMFSGQPFVFNTLSVLIILGMSFYVFAGHTESKLAALSSCMIISGGIGNMIDRIAFGEVTDFIYFKLIDFAIFNGADSFVCVGAGLLVLSLILEIVKEEKERRKKNNASSGN